MFKQSSLPNTVSKIMANKRDTDRVETTFSAIIFEDGEFSSHCIIRDVSVTGMKLELPAKTKIPDFFELKTPAIPEKVSLRTVWRKGSQAGVEFHFPEEEEEEDEQEVA